MKLKFYFMNSYSMIKMIKNIFVLTAIVMIQACGFAPQIENSGGGIELSIQIADSFKTASPDMPYNSLTYTIIGEGPGGKTCNAESNSGNNTIKVGNLIPGTWHIIVQALFNKAPFGSGEAYVAVSAGLTTDCIISITPDSGEGTFHITVNWDNTLVVNPGIEAVLVRTGYDSITPSFTISSGQAVSSVKLSGGVYTLELAIKDSEGNIRAGIADSVRIINKLETSETYNLDIQQCFITNAFWEKN